MSNILSTWLKNNGFQILGINQREVVMTRVDGKDRLGELIADYTVRKNKKSYVVVAGSGDPTEPELRRKLIEYDRVFGLSGVLLIDPEKNEIQEVVFKIPRERGLDFYFQFLGAVFLILLVIGIIWLMVQMRLF